MVERRSSTSSSERSSWPWAALLALLALLALDRAWSGSAGAWEAISARVPMLSPTNHVTARERSWLAGVGDRASGDIAILGTSRGMAALDGPRIERALGARAVKLARPGHEPFQIRALAEDVARARPDAVVMTLSEFNTHRPVRIEPVSGRGIASLGAVGELLRATGPGFAWNNRGTLYRLLTASSLRAYRFRDLLGAAGTDRVRRFPRPDRLRGVLPAQAGAAATPAERSLIAFGGGEPLEVDDELASTIEASFDGPLARTVRTHQIPMLVEIGSGDHVAVQEALLRGAVREWSDEGIPVLLVEAPLHPSAAELYDTSTREEFLRFASELERLPGVSFLPIEETGPFGPEDFADLLHLGRSGQDKITGVVADELVRLRAGPARD